MEARKEIGLVRGKRNLAREFSSAIIAEYKIHADKCRELANLVTTPTEKRILEEMAQSREKLAELRKRDR